MLKQGNVFHFIGHDPTEEYLCVFSNASRASVILYKYRNMPAWRVNISPESVVKFIRREDEIPEYDDSKGSSTAKKDMEKRLVERHKEKKAVKKERDELFGEEYDPTPI